MMNLGYSLKYPNIICSFKPKPLFSSHARDRVVEFGKHKGKMLGTLPSTYLKWVSKNMRAGDSEEWAKLADQVLQDPVYQDRVEWEFANNVLDGNAHLSSTINGENAVPRLLEISERFGWDNEDKEGWSKVNFELLGTSKGGRIPRKSAAALNDLKAEKNRHSRSHRQRALTESEMRRKERKKEQRERKDKLGIIMNHKDKIVNEEDAVETMINPNPFLDVKRSSKSGQ